jgi:flagellar hook-associated protein 1 FlgK
MGASSLMSLGTRAMFANYAALQTTGNNISNANTPGYSRQSVDLQTAGGQFTGAGYFGRGVDVATVTRSHDAFLTKEAGVARSMAASDQARLSQLQQLEKVFQTGESGLGYAAGQLLNAFVDVGSRPADASARQVVLARAEELASRFRAGSEQISVLQNGVVQDVKNSVSAVNDLAKQVAAINGRITQAQGSGHTPNDLLDQRDQLVSEISQYIPVSSVFSENGAQNLFIGGGQVLVLGSQSTELSTVLDPYDASQVRVGVRDAAGTRILPDSTITTGSIAGLLRFQDEDIRDARNLIGQMATALSSAVNQQQALGLDLGNPPGAGGAMFSVGAPQVQAARTNSSTAALGLTVTNAVELQATDYELRYDGAQYTLTRTTDDQAMPGSPYTDADLAAGIQFGGVTLTLNSGAVAAGDRFQLRPVANAAGGMQRTLTNPKGIAAASPVSATVDTSNRGTASVGALRVTTATPNPVLTATQSLAVRFTSGTNYDIELVDSSSLPATASVIGSGVWTPGQPIRLADTAPYAGWELDITGVPRGPETVNGLPLPGDAIAVRMTTFPESNNGNALALVSLATQNIVGQQTLQDGTVISGVNVTDAYANAMATIGLRVQTRESAAEMSQSVASSAEAERANKAGVNLDEEAARLMQYQQSYQAAAKMLQVAQSVFDTLLDVTRS